MAAGSRVARLVAWVAALPEPAVLGGAILGIAAAAVVDWLSGPDLSLLLFYGALVGAVSWRSTWGWMVVAVTLVCVGTAAAQLVGPVTYPLPVVLWNAAARFVFLLFGGWALMELRDSLTREHRHARTDRLTGAANRFAFYEGAKRELARARRERTPLAGAFLDLDDLKGINDTLGHEAGDRVLRRVAAVIEENLRLTDVFARIGGDEFILVLPGADLEAAQRVGERIVADLAEDDEAVSVSVGIAAWPPSDLPDTVDAVLAAADRLMYEAKRTGGNRVVAERAGG